MTIATVVVNSESPALEKKSQEASLIEEALHMAAGQIKAGQGLTTSGTMSKGGPNGPTVLGTWTITLQATQP
jgi:hypothetical protein